jgi:hypothetical protein
LRPPSRDASNFRGANTSHFVTERSQKVKKLLVWGLQPLVWAARLMSQ